MIQVVEVLADLFRAAPMCSTDDGSRRGRSTAASSGRRPRHQRRLLVSAGVLPQREEYLSRLETAFSRMIEQTPGEDRGSSPGISNGTCCRVSGDGSRPAVTRTNMHPGTRHAVRAATPGRRTPLARREEIGSLRQPVLDQLMQQSRLDECQDRFSARAHVQRTGLPQRHAQPHRACTFDLIDEDAQCSHARG